MGYLWIVLSVLILFLVFKRLKKPKVPAGLKEVPLAEDCLPILGHYLKVSPETLQPFIEKCYQKYGQIFKLKFFNQTWIIVCDKEFFPTFYSAGEEALSFFKMLNRFYVLPAFNMKESKVTDWMPALRQSMSSRIFKERCSEDKKLCKEIAAEAIKLSLELKNGAEGNPKSGIDLTPILLKHICSVSSKILFGIKGPAQSGNAVFNFTQTLNKVIEWATILPHFLVRLVFQKTFDSHVSKISAGFRDLIKEYKTDGSKDSIKFLRFLSDSKSQKTNRPLSETEIGKILSLVLFVSAESTTGTMVLTLLNVITRPEILQQLRKEVGPVVGKGDWDALLDAPILHGCVMETARLGGKPCVSNRSPAGSKEIGGYYIGDADFVTVAANLHHTNKNSFPQEQRFSPGEYLDKKGYHVLTWGAGTHLCPARTMALKMIKVTIAILIMTIKDAERTFIGNKKLFTNSAIAEVEHKVFIRADLSKPF